MRNFIFISLGFFALGCDGGDVIVAYQAPKEISMQATNAPAPPSTSPSANADVGMHWTVPAGWQPLPAKAMRLAGFKTSDRADAAEVSVSRFAAGAFGSPLDNVNRWRNMVGLLPLENSNDVPAPQHVAVDGKEADVYDFSGEGANAKRIHIVVLPSPDKKMMYFLRLYGPADDVAASLKSFDAFVQSAHFDQP